MSKRERDEVDPLVVAIKKRDAMLAIKEETRLSEKYPDPPTAHVEDTVKCLEQLVMLTPTSTNGYVTIRVTLCSSYGGISHYVCPTILTGDKWWTSICDWGKLQVAQFLKDKTAVTWVNTQRKKVAQLLQKTWLDFHPGSSIVVHIFDLVISIRAG